jgi:restriction system protein
MAVWVVRAERHGEMEDLALEQGIVVIGWSELPDLAAIKSREELYDVCRKVYPEAKPANITSSVGQCWAFRERIQVGELVVLPLKRRAAVAVGRVTGPYHYRPDLPPRAYHTRPVEWVRKDLPRSAFDADQDILLSLGGQLTVFQIQREHAEERVLAAVAGKPPTSISYRAEAPKVGMVREPQPELQPLLDLEEYARDQIRTHVAHNFRSHNLAHLVDAVLNAQGYQTHVSPPGPDGGVDIIAGLGPLGFDPPRLCVQVKSSDQPLDVRTLRELSGVMKNFGAQHGLFVSWGGFKQTVLAEASKQFFEIRLWDAGDLINAVLEHYERLPADLRGELPLKRIWTLVPEE